jgi:hypothetical protein
MAMCKKNDYKCGDLLEEALLQNRDDAEDILKYFSSLVSIYNVFCFLFNIE